MSNNIINTIMKYLYSIVLLSLLVVCSCGSRSDYKPVDGYSGKIKEIKIYKYSSEIEKNERIAKLGLAIPDEIHRYDERGNEVLEVSISFPDEFIPYYEVRIDSVVYDENNNSCKEIYRYFLQNDTDGLIEIVNTHNSTDCPGVETISINNIKYNKHNKQLRIESNVTAKVFGKEYISGYSEWNNYNDFIKSVDSTWTIIKEYEYDDTTLVYERESSGKDTTLNKYTYDNGLLISDTCIQNGNISVEKYKYVNGKRSERVFEGGFAKYDSDGHEIYFETSTRKENVIYQDSVRISENKFDQFTSISYSYPYQTFDSKIYIYISVEEEYYSDDVINIFTNFRDKNISESELRSKLEEIIRKDDGAELSIESTNYKNIDDHGNPLLIMKTYERFMNPRKYLSAYLKPYASKELNKTSFTNYTEKEISYY